MAFSPGGPAWKNENDALLSKYKSKINYLNHIYSKVSTCTLTNNVATILIRFIDKKYMYINPTENKYLTYFIYIHYLKSYYNIKTTTTNFGYYYYYYYNYLFFIKLILPLLLRLVVLVTCLVPRKHLP